MQYLRFEGPKNVPQEKNSLNYHGYACNAPPASAIGLFKTKCRYIASAQIHICTPWTKGDPCGGKNLRIFIVGGWGGNTFT